MDTDEIWLDLQARLDDLETGTKLETPVSKRRFAVRSIENDRVIVQFTDSGEERSLWRDQFDVIVDSVRERPIPVETLQPGVEPYVTVLTLSSVVAVERADVLFDPEAATPDKSPYLVSPAEARTPPVRLHDDALLLAEHLDRLDVANPSSLGTESLTDAYVLSSDVQRRANRLRQTFRDELLARLGPEQTLHGRFGTIRRTTRKRRSVRAEEDVFAALDQHDIPREWVMGIDPEKLDVVLSVTDVDEEDVYDVSESVYVQKTGVEEDEKYELLAGVRDRLTELEGVEGEQIRAELTDIESRIEEALGAD